MSFAEVFQCLSRAWQLFMQRPVRWLLYAALLLLISEGAMLIPKVGFVLKMLLASLLAAMFLRLYAEAAAGRVPRLRELFAFWTLPASGILAILICGLIPFAVGIAWLHQQAGMEAVGYFFGNVLVDEPPSAQQFERFKIILYLVSMPLMFIPAAVVLKGLSGIQAWAQGLAAAWHHWRGPVLFFLISVGFELLMSKLPSLFPLAGVVIVGLFGLLLFVAFMLAFTFTLAQKALNLED